MIELNDIEERVILVGVQQADGDDTEESVKELGELAQTAGAQVVGSRTVKKFIRGHTSEKENWTRCG